MVVISIQERLGDAVGCENRMKEQGDAAAKESYCRPRARTASARAARFWGTVPRSVPGAF